MGKVQLGLCRDLGFVIVLLFSLWVLDLCPCDCFNFGLGLSLGLDHNVGLVSCLVGVLPMNL